jgi:hypothetical protein
MMKTKPNSARRQLITSGLVLALVACVTPEISGQKDPRVLLIGVDGLRPDALAQAATPHMDELIRHGAFTAEAQVKGEYRGSDTLSGPGWASILTGVWSNKHGVYDNTFQGARLDEYPHFFERLKTEHPDAQTISMVSWAPIDTHLVSGADIRRIKYLAAGAQVNFQLAIDTEEVNTRDGEWHHLLGSREGKTLSLYLDGRHVGSEEDVAGDADLTGDFYYIGQDARPDLWVFNGDLDQVRLWNRALGREEVAAIVRAGPPQARRDAAAAGAVDERDLLAAYYGEVHRLHIPISGRLAGMTQGDFTLEAWFRTTYPGRGILMGNYDVGENGLNLELEPNNGFRLYMHPSLTRLDYEEEMDVEMATAAVELLGEQDPAAIFVYFHQTDTVGHILGFSPEVPRYIEAVENVDREIGRVLEALRARPSYEEEDWLILVASDHGGLGRTHRRGRHEPQILTVPLIVSGPAVEPGRIAEPAFIVDLVPTMLAHLGIEIDPRWGLDGKVIGLRR